MEIQRVSDSSIKIKSKNATFLIDSSPKSESEVAIFTQPPDSYSDFTGLVISGPGEYETAGVSIKGEKHGEKTTYTFLEENQNVLVTSASSLASIKEIEEGSFVVVIADQSLGEAISELAAEIIILSSPAEFLPTDTTTFKKTDKINLKKTEEYKGFVVHLSK
jgi:hypothetical protein